MAIALAAVAVVTEYGPGFAAKLDHLDGYGKHRAIHEKVGAIARERGPGPLAEFPMHRQQGRPTAPDAMVGATIHGMPLVNGYTGYSSPGARQLRDALGDVRRIGGLADLADMTGLRWLLVRPRRKREAKHLVEALPPDSVSRVWPIDAWRLVEIRRPNAHPEWFEALKRGLRPHETVLGTPLAPLLPSASATSVEVINAPETMRPGERAWVTVRVQNVGTTTWPVAKPGRRGSPYLVALRASWEQRDGGPLVVHDQVRSEFHRDVAPGDVQVVKIPIQAPSARGPCQLRIAPGQEKGAGFAGKNHSPLVFPIMVE